MTATEDPVVARPFRSRRAWERLAADVITVVAALGVGAVVVGILETYGVADASPAFLLAVVTVAVLRGTAPAVTAAVGGFLIYDFFFIEPRYTLTVHDPAEWLNLLLLLVVGVVVGQLAGRERARALTAIEGERQANALFRVSYLLATREETSSVLDPIAEVVRAETGASRVWITVGDSLAADTADASAGPPPDATVHTVLRRRPGDEPATWVRVHVPGRAPRGASDPAVRVFRVAINAGGRTFGSIWASRARELADLDPGGTRVMAAAADQVGGALDRDALQRDATVAEISRRSEALKSALLDSVSHDLRTPLASIRAAAGSLMDPDVAWPDDQRREIAASIDREAEWLNRLVSNLLDMSRVEAGELKPNLVALVVADLVVTAIERIGGGAAGHELVIDIPDGLPPVLVDEVFIGQVLGNTLDNALKYSGDGSTIRVSAGAADSHRVRITVEDDGPGVPAESLPRLFEKFYRVPRRGEGSRRGTGIGLAVVRGLVESMAGTVEARRSDLGGLAVDIVVPVAAADGHASDVT